MQRSAETNTYKRKLAKATVKCTPASMTLRTIVSGIVLVHSAYRCKPLAQHTTVNNHAVWTRRTNVPGIWLLGHAKTQKHQHGNLLARTTPTTSPALETAYSVVSGTAPTRLATLLLLIARGTSVQRRASMTQLAAVSGMRLPMLA